ncbi:bifunctional [glutamate--ammonia ligase]-adenylyl-L-tyrosine phosphorylase/[glutamate--ammonia-ligase] adenylyltransferase [Exilibacterium tricleocarpae]|uniref:Bifunctional glutamine synthetase adenylyltransferase/adenylyl-removing enzyme n=1 Tax=Exilibacterium tricleocarpae TaxID=2591008 RepID=A0A545TK98_9GAMM|nr:bifunctional [glutamate--ammonia ligase]-adenylyl-L-tyrosine phosphorylase/[glutamate--ammonia-ligase] adenylyltransferase [Exilibacterium tricleocarpae]TQV77643.1 bifunctional [glutamate--ammonia ligase]-adenylyl-L-tyrosine phosphorylase/[glutamate--ammonia-ligase] adenylyltransferase [Exilibacterium tricleocarpae]
MLFDKDLLDDVPSAFHPELRRYQAQFAERAGAAGVAQAQNCLSTRPHLRQQLLRVWVGSDFAAQACITNPDMLLEMLQRGDPDRPLEASTLAPELARQLGECSGEQALDQGLRRYRQRTMVHVIWRDLNRLATLEETTGALSALADACIGQAMAFHYRELAQKWGVPTGGESGAVQPMLVLAMGKLGAGELNLSSDVDLIFAYPETGATNGARKNLTNQEFFSRLGKKLIKSLEANTADGFVFRVDMRLRPYGQSGALVFNFDALEDYYQTQGREWERYAMIKARVAAVAGVADGTAVARQLLALLRPFTYRKYIDYSAVEALRSMKALINREVQRKGMGEDVKLGPGGIREIEFIVQAFQLIRGGRDRRLQERRLLVLLPVLEAQGCLPAGAAAGLDSAYRFLRNTEHAVQAYQDRQTQMLPTGELDRRRLAWSLGYGDWAAFTAALDSHRTLVNAEFQAVIADPHDDVESERDRDWIPLWQAQLDRDQALALLGGHYRDSDAGRVFELLEQLRESRHIVTMQAAGRERLDEFVPRLLGALAEQDETAETLARVLPLVEAVARRSAYLVLLMENPGALKRLISLCAASPWIAGQLVKSPALLDELLDPRTLYSPPDKESLRDELRREVLRLSWEDLEGHMEALRYFKAAHALRVAASEVTDVLPLMKVSDYLTYIAEVILEHVLAVAWRQMVDRHGRPGGAQDDDMNFVIVGYGKLGGIELGHGSDLDLVFLHSAEAGRFTDGERQLDNQTFYTRLGQKIIHILTAQTLGGTLYEVDVRLRPSGNSGLLVSSLAGFEKYQGADAWTWEHQALVRARVVAGSRRLAGEFEAVRAAVLCRRREDAELRREVVQMRDRMREHLATRGAAQAQDFNIKHDRGGIVDIEFVVQYAVLAWAYRDAALVRYTDNIRILGCLEEAGLLGTQEVTQLIDAYKAYRSMGHRLALQGQASVLSGSQFNAERETVERVWQRLLESP